MRRTGLQERAVPEWLLPLRRGRPPGAGHERGHDDQLHGGHEPALRLSGGGVFRLDALGSV